MSVLIKGMEMPTSCGDCRFAVDGWCYACPPESEAERQRITTNYCPLVPVPPHGDLIDRDEQIERAWRLKLSTRELIEEMLKTAPAIIPAESEV